MPVYGEPSINTVGCSFFANHAAHAMQHDLLLSSYCHPFVCLLVRLSVCL